MAQQTLILNGGEVLHGRYDGGNPDTVNFVDEHGNRRAFPIREIQNLMFTPAEGADRYSKASMPPEPRANQYQNEADWDRDEHQGQWNRAATIPAGTELVVRTIDRIDSSSADPRTRFRASMERDVRDDNGNVIVPRGASAHLIVSDAGRGMVTIDLRSVNVNGRRLVLDASDLTNGRDREGLGANSRTGKYVGGGAVLGGIIGAIAGGGKGAAIGAAAGGAAGAGAEVATSGPRIHIPSETILRFHLDHPVYLYQ